MNKLSPITPLRLAGTLALQAAFAFTSFAEKQAVWSADDTWAFLPGEDPYTDKALFDLRPLLDNVAGEKGWIRHDANGDFVRGDGSPIRFWATGSSVFDLEPVTMERMEAHAKHLAKRGINMVRLFNAKLRGKDDATPLATPNDRAIERFQMAVTAMKRQGIYSFLTIYWDHDGRLFWDPELQAAYKNWWRELLTRPNPFCPNKTPLKDDPAIAVLQIQNEDSWFFWSIQGLWRDAKRKAEYDTVNAKFKAWLAKNELPDADLDLLLWDISRGDPTHAHEPRESLKHSMRFAAEMMREFNAEIQRFLRDDIGCPALVSANNWTTANQVRLLDLERWTYDANEVIAKNQYVDIADHKNYNGREGWLVEPGCTFVNESTLRGDNWRHLPTNTKQIKGKPFMVTETGWVRPNLYQAEAPFLLSAYMSLTGVDACFWLGLSDVGYSVNIRPWQVGLQKWQNHASPANMGGWPAAAWMFHKGYIKRGAVVVDEKRNLVGDMWELKAPVIAEDSTFDPNQPGTQRVKSNIIGGVHFGAFMTGQVLVEYGRDSSETVVNLHGRDPADFARGVLKSTTGEVLMDTPRGICVIDAPCAQGVVGFLQNAGTVETSALAIDMQNDYGAVLAVSLDGLPLTQSKKILLQTTTLARPDGWADEQAVDKDGKDVLRIVNTGGGLKNAGENRWNVKNTRGGVLIKNNVLTKATQADINFYPQAELPVQRRGGSLAIKLPPNALYVVLE